MPGINTASHMFDKGAEEAAVELGNAKIRVDDYSGFFVHGNIGRGFGEAVSMLPRKYRLQEMGCRDEL